MIKLKYRRWKKNALNKIKSGSVCLLFCVVLILISFFLGARINLIIHMDRYYWCLLLFIFIFYHVDTKRKLKPDATHLIRYQEEGRSFKCNGHDDGHTLSSEEEQSHQYLRGSIITAVARVRNVRLVNDGSSCCWT